MQSPSLRRGVVRRGAGGSVARGDATSGGNAIALFGAATSRCDSGFTLPCLAASLGGPAYGGAAVSVLGDADACGHEDAMGMCTAVAVAGRAEGGYAGSVLGPASGTWIGVSVLGPADGKWLHASVVDGDVGSDIPV